MGYEFIIEVEIELSTLLVGLRETSNYESSESYYCKVIS